MQFVASCLEACKSPNPLKPVPDKLHLAPTRASAVSSRPVFKCCDLQQSGSCGCCAECTLCGRHCKYLFVLFRYYADAAGITAGMSAGGEEVLGLQAGQLADETREALGLGPLDPPPWLDKMRQLGYPPMYKYDSFSLSCLQHVALRCSHILIEPNCIEMA